MIFALNYNIHVCPISRLLIASVHIDIPVPSNTALKYTLPWSVYILGVAIETTWVPRLKLWSWTWIKGPYPRPIVCHDFCFECLVDPLERLLVKADESSLPGYLTITCQDWVRVFLPLNKLPPWVHIRAPSASVFFVIRAPNFS